MENKMETRLSLISEEGYLVLKWLLVPGEPSEWLFRLPSTCPGVPISTYRREPRLCIENAVRAPFIMSTKVMSFKSCPKVFDFICFPAPLVVCIESKYH